MVLINSRPTVTILNSAMAKLDSTSRVAKIHDYICRSSNPPFSTASNLLHLVVHDNIDGASSSKAANIVNSSIADSFSIIWGDNGALVVDREYKLAYATEIMISNPM